MHPYVLHPYVRVEPDPAGYRWLRLARADRHNALDAAMTRAVLAALRADRAVPLLIAGSSPGLFCAGADLTVADAERAEISELIYECCEAIITRPGPVLAVVGGPAVGGGAQLAAAADLRIASPAARFRFIGPRGRGLAVGAWVLPDLVGRGAALELTLTGRWVGAAEALQLGLVNQVCADPGTVAAGLAQALTGGAAEPGAAGPGAAEPGAAGRIKAVTAAGGLLDRLREERRVNRTAWNEPR